MQIRINISTERINIYVLTLNCRSHLFVGPCAWFAGKGRYGNASSLRWTPANRAKRSSRHESPTSSAPTARPAHGKPRSIATSWRVGVISPTGRWNVCVSGRQRSRSAARRDMSNWNRGALSLGRRAGSAISPSTSRAIGRRPEARSLHRENETSS